MQEPSAWAFDTGSFGAGIDNLHVDVYLSPRFRELAAQTVHNLITEDLTASLQQTPVQLVSAADLERFRRRYIRLFESTLERDRSALSADRLALLQLALLRWMLALPARETRALAEQYQRSGAESTPASNAQQLDVQDQLTLLERDGPAINRRVLKLLFRQLRKLESGPLHKLRRSISTEVWPFPRQAFFNPVLTVADPCAMQALYADYPVASLGEHDDVHWLQLANKTLVEVFSDYLPDFCRGEPHDEITPQELPARVRKGRDQGLRCGYLTTELLLSRFLSEEEYRSGQVSWLDEPTNLRRFLHLPESVDVDSDSSPVLWPSQWASQQWQEFRRATRAQLHQRLEQAGAAERIVLCYWLPTLRARLGVALPLSVLVDYCTGRLSRSQLTQQLGAFELAPDARPPAALATRLDVAAGAGALEQLRDNLRRLGPAERAPYLDRLLSDFLVLRRDLKLAYKTYEAMDRLRLLENDDEVNLSRGNATLYEFVDRKEAAPLQPRIRAHAVVKADIRGSTRITDALVELGLNPASHFSLNLFAPVNRLLPAFGAEKLFVEGDAVIMALYEYERESGGAFGEHPVARACALARKVLQTVALRNTLNRRHALPELELGLGIAFSPREPNFLYDEGRRIMISGAINGADRLSSCASVLRASGVRPPGQGQHVLVLHDVRTSTGPLADDGLLAFNVNGIRLEQQAFFRLQHEITMHQARLSVPGDADGLYFHGSFSDALGRDLHIAVRCAPVREWDGRNIGDIEPEHRHYFEVMIDEHICAALRKQAC
jgi:class 3 adenylate cyclase